MKCETVAENLTELMEGELDSDQEAAALEHLSSCEHCETVLAETREVVELARLHGRPELGDDDRERMLASIVDEMGESAPE